MLRVLVADSDLHFAESAVRWFRRRGHLAEAAGSFEEASAFLRRKRFDVLVADVDLPGPSGQELLRVVIDSGCGIAAVLTTNGGSIDGAVRAMKSGAADYVPKPCRLDDLEHRCIDAVSSARTSCSDGVMKSVRPGEPALEMIGRSHEMLTLGRLIKRVGPSGTPVLIDGESGTGKELVARALQRSSTRRYGAFVTVNCAALPEQLLESEFFGHEKGAFTGASAAKQGLFESADGGTLFVDEVGELAPSLQAKLLRVLEDGTFRRVGSLKELRADVRVIAATNRNLFSEVSAGRFREDLYYRLNVITLHVPPLRERRGDVSLLASAFIGDDWRLDNDAAQAMERYRWPGNVRQLKNAITRAKVLASRGVIRLCDLPVEVAFTSSEVPIAAACDDIESQQREHVLKILSREQGNKARTARILGVNRRSLYRMLERYAHNGCAYHENGKPR